MLIREMLGCLKEDEVEFLKVGGGVGERGNDGNVYKSRCWYEIGNFKDINGYYSCMGMGGVMGMSWNNSLGSRSVKGEMRSEYEFGVCGRLFGKRLRVDGC